ncbi:MAG: NAD+ synthase [Chloroflexi bacterium RBG_16_56_11]|nr:MAG: NAD+ synthase [Chloroflexi bacterium RBG_16_56_11]
MAKWPETRRLRIGMAQINTTVGDFTGNIKRILKTIEEARSSGVDLLTFPELAVCGYPPEDLLFKPQFIADNLHALDKVVEASAGITLVVGFVDANSDIFNAAAIIHDGKLAGVYHKIFLPNYGVFDENRYFQSGKQSPVYVIGGINVGVNICEDIWYESGPSTSQAYSGADVIVNISASPYHFGKADFRERMIAARAADNVAIFAFNNLVGGQDELVFDGNSLIIDEKGQLLARGKRFKEDLIVADLDVENVFRTRLHDPRWRQGRLRREEQGWVTADKIVISETLPAKNRPRLESRPAEPSDLVAEVYEALVLGTRDYILKNGFKKVLIGLSGGIDSSLVATVAVDALGKSNVVGVAMPSRFSSGGSLTDAGLLAKNLGINLLNIPIEGVFQAFLATLAEPFKGTEFGIAEENLQARVRGTLLMSLSNKFGWLVLTTGNKSEYATGYTTLYGDMAGGFAVIKDVPKTMVYRLTAYRNRLAGYELIPATVIRKPPSAELRPGQLDTDSLPAYEILDPVITAYVEEDKSIEQIVASGIDEKVVRRAARLVDTSEYKRRQAPPGVKITPRAFGRDRRLPITNRFKRD